MRLKPSLFVHVNFRERRLFMMEKTTSLSAQKMDSLGNVGFPISNFLEEWKKQCDRKGLSCWCVDEKGIEVTGTKQSGSSLSCEFGPDTAKLKIGLMFLPAIGLSFCQLQKQQILVSRYINSSETAYIPQCLDSGDFDPVLAGVRFETVAFCMVLEKKALHSAQLMENSCLSNASLSTQPIGWSLILSIILTGPSKCEIEYFAATRFEEDYKPLCEEIGAYKPTQCQLNGECWCVDSRGQEIPGTRRRGQQLICVLSSTSGKTSAVQLLTFETLLGEAVGGMFPSRELAQIALRFTSNPKRFQENLFGGMFLKNLVQFNFTGALGPNSKFNLDKYFQQVGMRSGFSELAGQLLQGSSQEKFNRSQSLVDSFGRKVSLEDNQKAIQFLASLLETPEFFSFLQHVISVPESVTRDLGKVVRILLKARDCTEEDKDALVPDCTVDGNYKEIQCNRGECWCVDLRGKEIPGSRVQGTNPRCPTVCEKQRASLQLLIRDQPAGFEMFVPSCTQEGKFLPVQCHGKNCFCVNSDGIPVPGISTNSGDPIKSGQAFLRSAQKFLLNPTALTQLSNVYVPQCSLDGQWRPIQCNGPPEQAFEWYQRWNTQNNNNNVLAIPDLANILLDYKARSQQSFEDFIKILYTAGHQNVFPEFFKYSSFEAVPQDLLKGNTLQISENALLDPFTFWQLLQGRLNHYPGSYSDFSLGTCEAAKREAVGFVNNVEQLIQESNSSHFPFGQSFLMSQGSVLRGRELWSNFSQLESTFAEILLAGSDYAIQLAAQSTLQFYRKSLFASLDSAGEALRLAFLPYIPQCDGQGNWEPIQCYESTGHCWCVDETGRYVSDSLMTRSTQLPQCKSDIMPTFSSECRDCQLENEWTDTERNFSSSVHAVLSRGKLYKAENCPSYCNLLKSKALVQEIGRGYIPECESDPQGFSPVQCSEDQASCWCVFDNGQEAPGTRVNGQRSACERPRCPLPYNASSLINSGVFCNINTANTKTQQCQMICYPGYQDVFSQGDSLLCDTESLLWLTSPPHSHACQRLQPFQSVQIQTQFQLILPPKKTCSPDYSGLLETFQIFILDELKSRGFCHIQVSTLENLVSVPVCGDSAVLVQCAAADRLGVNVTWQAMLKNVPVTALPDLYDIVLRRFEKVPASNLIFTTKESETIGTKTLQGTPMNTLQQCVAECEEDESCGFLTLSAMGSETLCELYSARESNYNCSASGLVTTLRCLIKVRSPDKKDSLNVYLKKGQEFTTAGVKRFEKTDFQDVVSGVYSISVVSASGTSLTDVHLFCRQACHQDACCDGFILSQFILDGASELAEDTEKFFTSFQRVYFWKASIKKLFSIVERNQILTELNRPLPSQKYWLFKQRYSAEEALLWCLTRCVEDEFCLLADIPNNTDTAFFPCTLYPAAQVCNTSINNIPNNCKIVLPQNPQLLYQKTVPLEGSVKNFYTRLPFRKVSGVSVRNKMDMSGKTVSNGFFDCERLCDADLCCSGFGLLNASQDTDSKILCLTLGSLGIQTCSDELRSDWQISPCTSLETEARVHPFGWYQKS
ncbi:hypothetical protein Chor_002631, partial [Crotalus horridus]